ncbi:MAG: hypothetical protein IT442_08675 [Phycisphaeraceae bacterium]|nr:hypothetical protein [Phycisphaeraceae bacterium]
MASNVHTEIDGRVEDERGMSLAGRLAAAAMGAACLSLLVALVGCNDPVRRYRVLSLFFDGVPPPPGVVAPPNPDEEGYDESSVSATQPSGLAAEEVVYYHKPYATRQCYDCHEKDQSLAAPKVGRELCGKCHKTYWDRKETDWVHGPVAVDDCRVCHDPHKSTHRPLLTAGAKELCFTCHDREAVLGEPYHAEVGDRCTTCHDPHFSGNRILLVDAGSYKRRAEISNEPASAHTVWGSADCERCHVTAQSNTLRPNIEEQCLSCHQDVLTPTEGTLHEAVTKKACLTCHTPHRSPKDHLLRTAGEAICFSCHKPEEIRDGKHPKLERADCFVCHAGHRSDREHRLRPGVAGQWPTTEPAPTPGGRSVLGQWSLTQPTTEPTTAPTTTPATGPTTEPATVPASGPATTPAAEDRP